MIALKFVPSCDGPNTKMSTPMELNAGRAALWLKTKPVEVEQTEHRLLAPTAWLECDDDLTDEDDEFSGL